MSNRSRQGASGNYRPGNRCSCRFRCRKKPVVYPSRSFNRPLIFLFTRKAKTRVKPNLRVAIDRWARNRTIVDSTQKILDFIGQFFDSTSQTSIYWLNYWSSTQVAASNLANVLRTIEEFYGFPSPARRLTQDRLLVRCRKALTCRFYAPRRRAIPTI